MVKIHNISLTKFLIRFNTCFFDWIICVILELVFSLDKVLRTYLNIIIFGSTKILILADFNVAVTLLFQINGTSVFAAVPVVSTLKSSNSSVFYLGVTWSNFTACWTIDIYQSNFTIITILFTCHYRIHLIIKIRLTLYWFIIFAIRCRLVRMKEARVITTF